MYSRVMILDIPVSKIEGLLVHFAWTSFGLEFNLEVITAKDIAC